MAVISLCGWAKLTGAYNAVTGEVMASGLTADALEILGQIVFAGYKGWHDDTAEQITLSYLADLAARDCYDREVLLAYARMDKSSSGIDRLEKILDTFEKSEENSR